ncbi:ADP-ribosylglycohydrolase family protein [Methanococcus voltae]|uniref:ADP-ribosylation/Crystallin J1 n=1 Tax=Methanococcus voltae (strain ATCC BAA-1334 / A3) TaxID=456320 RepID=D7DRG5_METV3|nr:ADP-ribosylglycohydrolase family protein [Methanococcus voltae]MCS3901102.1 ADP-ribosylglycohydrolase [Methanococcus voltae]
MVNKAQAYEDKYKGCIIGLSVGDALGMPVEWFTRAQIEEMGGIREYIDPINKFKGILKAGDYTDDTEQTLALSNAFDKFGYSEDKFIENLLYWYNHNPIGIGPTSSKALENLSKGIKKGMPSETCGSAMRTAPLGLFYYDDLSKLVEKSISITKLTHNSPNAVAGALSISYMVSKCLIHGIAHNTYDRYRLEEGSDDGLGNMNLIKSVYEKDVGAFLSKDLEEKKEEDEYKNYKDNDNNNGNIDYDNDISKYEHTDASHSTYAKIIEYNKNVINKKHMEKGYNPIVYIEETKQKRPYQYPEFRKSIEDCSHLLIDTSIEFSEKILDILEICEKVHNSNYDKKVILEGYDKLGTGINAIEAVPSAIFSFMISNSFKSSLLNSINAGGDTDSIGSMCGALAGTYYGYNAIPKKWVNGLSNNEKILNTAINLYNLKVLD